MLLGYAIHARGQYDDLDRALVVSAGHAAAEASTFTDSSHLSEARGDLEIVLRLYTPDGVLQDSTLGTEALPSIDPRTVLREPAGPAYDGLAHLVPPLTLSS